MATTSIGSSGVTFPDSTTQSSGKQAAKAWVNFDGSTGTINGSFNVSSITRNNTGYYTVNFTTAMPNANYTTNISVSSTGSVTPSCFLYVDAVASNTVLTPTTSAFSFCSCNYTQNTRYDPTYCMASVFSS